MTSLKDLVFLPRPRHIEESAGSFALSAGIPLVLRGDVPCLLSIADKLQAALRLSRGIECPLRAAHNAPGGRAILLSRGAPDWAGFHPQGYRMRVTPSEASISASDPAGLFYGAMTFIQILRQCGGAIPCGQIDDVPDFTTRGVMLDISRDKVPSMETLFDLIDLLAELKVNHFQLYTEHTFAYSRHQEVWAGSSPMTGEEILRLDRYCRDRFMELVPNQNSFGHMNRWLTLPRYRGLAECPDGFTWPWGGRSRHPFSLDPSNPDSFSLLEELYGELLPHFESRLFNVGCDETWDLGQGKSGERCRREGKGRVYLEFLLAIHALVARHGRTMLFWGDIIMQHPELVPELPRDVVALDWGYEADHPFGEETARLAASGIPFYVCPGTSSWNSIAGRTGNCLANLRSAAHEGLSHGALGYLITDWGDDGHWQAIPASYLGLAAGAAYCWCLEANESIDIASGLDAHVFRDKAGVMGGIAFGLGNAYLHTGGAPRNESLLFHLLLHPEIRELPGSVTVETLGEARRFVESTVSPLDDSRMDRRDAALVRDELSLAARLLLHAIDRALAIRRGTLEERDTRAGLSAELRIVIGEYERLWMRRNRVGGLFDSVGGLVELLRSTGPVPSARRSQM